MRYAEQVTEYVRRLAPEQRRAIKAALREFESGEATATRPLEDELEGFCRLRVGKFRIVRGDRGWCFHSQLRAARSAK
jgi:mRNA-degrading endonuclease RelE of RelBE toxin-antitoxin system